MQTNYPVDDRNKLLHDVFKNLGYNVKLVGDKNQPKIVIDEQFSISGYVHNKLYHFTTQPFGGQVVKTISLNLENPITREELDHLIETCQKRKLWKLRLLTDPEELKVNLYYVKTENFVPFFSTLDCRFFFDLDKANQTQEYLKASYNIPTEIETY